MNWRKCRSICKSIWARMLFLRVNSIQFRFTSPAGIGMAGWSDEGGGSSDFGMSSVSPVFAEWFGLKMG